jgi:hypothetical protein
VRAQRSLFPKRLWKLKKAQEEQDFRNYRKTAQEIFVPRSPQEGRKGIDGQDSQRKFAKSRQPLDLGELRRC